MTRAKRKAKAALRESSMTYADLAKAAGLALSTVHAVLNNEKSSPKSRRAITNALGLEIWPGMQPDEPSGLFLEIGTLFIFQTINEASAVAETLAGKSEQRGREVRITHPVSMVIQPRGRASRPEEFRASTADTRRVIDIYSSGDYPPDSAFASYDQASGAANGEKRKIRERRSRSNPSAIT